MCLMDLRNNGDIRVVTTSRTREREEGEEVCGRFNERMPARSLQNVWHVVSTWGMFAMKIAVYWRHRAACRPLWQADSCSGLRNKKRLT